jgi:hypothetical protein
LEKILPLTPLVLGDDYRGTVAGLVAAIVLQAARTVLITLLSKAVHQATQTIDTKKAPRQKSRCLLVCFATK